MASIVEAILESRQLPREGTELIDFLTNADGTFIAQEGANWDFKERWPDSLNDEYFGGLCRLICAFSNTDGGIIVFGVDDKSRKPTASATASLPNMDRFEQAVRNILGVEVSLFHRRYDCVGKTAIDCLMVPPRSQQLSPIRFKKTLHKYPKDRIWVRARHEVREAQAIDIPKLYFSGSESSSISSAFSSLPPSPATVREFVGRMGCIDDIFSWLKTPDEPTYFLYGKGGSGKSTIAYELSTYLKAFPKSFRIECTDFLDQIIYISAKATYLNVDKLKAAEFTQNDFRSEMGLYQAILSLGGYAVSNADFADMAALRAHIKSFFESNSCFIVVDDIDTVTTAGEESGMVFLDRTLTRAKRKSKILYTQRNKPTFGIASSKEVPGLPDEEYAQFIDICCSQFNVPPPDADLKFGKLADISERRPLVLESVIALRRHSGSYKAAIEVFQQSDEGDNVREYVFGREWNAISPASNGRNILAILAEYGRPITFTDLVTISRLGASRVRDAISEVQEMFLSVEHEGEESRYSLGELTKMFILRAADSLDLWPQIQARVQMFKSTFYADSPTINRLGARFHRAQYTLRQGDQSLMHDFWLDLMHGGYHAKVSEDPRFLVLRAHAGLLLDAKNLPACRNDFELAFAMKSAPDLDAVRAWFDAERMSDMSEVQTKRIVSLVRTEKGYSIRDKADFYTRRGVYLFNFARNNMEFDPYTSHERMRESIGMHLEALKVFLDQNDYMVDKSWEYCRNTAYTLAIHLTRVGRSDFLVDAVESLKKRNHSLFFDPLAEPLILLFRRFAASGIRNLELIGRAANDLRRVREYLDDLALWYDKEERTRFLQDCRKMTKLLADMRKATEDE